MESKFVTCWILFISLHGISKPCLNGLARSSGFPFVCQPNNHEPFIGERPNLGASTGCGLS